MKRLISLALVMLVLSSQQSFSQDVAIAHPGADGIFISWNKVLPKTFSYRISRKSTSNENWQQVAELHFPENEAVWNANILREAQQYSDISIPDSTVTMRLWEKLKISTTSDSLYGWSYYPFMLAACGTGWWDRTAEKNQPYTYKIEKIKEGRVLSTRTTEAVSFPGIAPDFQMQLDSLQGNGIDISIKFQLLKHKGMGGCKVFRAYFKRSAFTQIHPQILFNNEQGMQYLTLYDKSVVNKAQYSYYLIPYDIYGNEGQPSDTVNVYNTRINTMKAIVSHLVGTSKEKENAIHLSWRITHPEDVISIDIYKALEYDGYYTKIASVSPTDTAFSDHNVQPVTTYFYTLVLHSAYGKTFPSARTVVIFKANKKNPFPPMNLKAVREGNVVKLNWQRAGSDIRGYYLYRSSSLTGKMQPVTNIILSKDSVVTYIDSLKNLPSSPVWDYAVASENTSYAISPLSNRASVSGETLSLPIPTGLTAIVNEGSVQLLWSNLFLTHPQITGYRIERKEDKGNNLQGSFKVLVDVTKPGINSYVDSAVKPGHHYLYRVASIGLKPGDLSSPSFQTGAYLPPAPPLAPGHVMALNTSKGVLLRWELPLGSRWQKIKIYRAQPGKKATMIKSLSANTSAYTDSQTEKGKNYFYWIATVDKEGRENKMKEPVGIRTEN